MSRPNQRLNASDNPVAYRVASLLRQPVPSASASHDTDTHSLRSMTSQIEHFLSMAPQVPPVRMEPEWTACDHSEENEEAYDALLQRGGQPVVQLNVVAGVLEEVDPAATEAHLSSMNGVLLPTAGNQQVLHRHKAEQAQAMLDLMSALAPSTMAKPVVVEEGGAATQGHANLSTRVQRHPSSDSDDDEVAVMDADDLNDEDTSDEEEMPAQRRRVQELN